MPNLVITFLVAVALFAAMAVASWVGARYARRRPMPDKEAEGAFLLVSSVFALLGLLVAFTFAAAFDRFNVRRKILVDEANAIGTAYLRLDLLPAEAQPALREKMRHYASVRARLHDDLVHPERANADMVESDELQQVIWSHALAASEQAPASTRMLLLPSLNEMFDITTTRHVAIKTHAPTLVFVTLFGIALICAGLVAYVNASRGRLGWLHALAFSVITLTLCVILDAEFPSYGLIRMDPYNQVLHDLRASMGG
jgi:hypothetical protein